MAKVVGFEIEIKGQKDILSTTKVLGLLNTQLILINNTLSEIDKKGGAGLKELNKEFKNTGSSAKKLGSMVKTSFDTFQKGNKVVQNLGNGYFEVSKQVDETAKEIGHLDKENKEAANSIKELVRRNKELKKTLESLPLDEQGDEVRQLEKEYTKNNKAITKFRKELRTGIKASEQSADSLNGLKNKSKQLTAQYASMSASQRRFTKEGRALGKQILKTNKQIAKLQRRLKGTNSLSKTLSKTFTKLFIGSSVLAGIGQLFSNVAGGLKEIATGSKEAKKQFSELNKSGDRLTSSLDTIGKEFLGAFGGGITKVINSVAFAVDVVGKAFISASEGTGFFAQSLRFVGDLITNFPAVFGGVGAVIGNFRDTFVNSITEIKLNTELLIATVTRLGTALTGGDTSQIENNIARINDALEKNVVFAKTIGEAYEEGYNATIKAQEEFNKSTDENIAKASKARAAERKKRREEEKKDREELLKQIEAQSEARIEIIKDLNQQLRELEIGAIRDTTNQAIAQEKERFAQEKAQRQKNLDDRVNEIVEQEAKITALFGSNSQELADFIENSEAQLAQVRDTNNKIAERQEQNHQDKLLQIEKDGEKARADAQTAAFNAEVAETEAELARIEAIESEADDRRVAASLAADKKLEEQRKVDQEKRAATVSATKDAAVDLVNATLSAISDISKIAFDAENRRFEQAIETRQNNISKLNEDLQNATGLQKKFLEIQVEQEKKALDEETKAQEEARKKQGEAQKAIAIVQAVIAAALGVANAFSLPPPASFVAAAATAVAAGAQIAVIASQKFADGGILQGPSHAQGGIKTSFGEMEGGEAVINKESTKRFAPLLSEINVAGGGRKFASGGITGPPLAPNIGSSQTDVNNSLNQFLQASMASTEATNSRIDRLQVNLDLNNLEDVQDNDSNLDTLTTF